MADREHLDDVTINRIKVDHNDTSYTVGKDGVTRIEATVKSGMYADIAYVRVWAGDKPVAEFCQHNIVGVYFK